MSRPSPFALAANLLDPPPPPEPDLPELLSPIAFALARSNGAWKTARHFEIIERAVLDAIENNGRVIISVSFRHGKSVFIARWLVAWFIGRYRKRVLLGTASKDLAEDHGGFARDLIDEHGPSLFGVEVSKKTSAKAKWELAAPHHAGGLLAVGVGSKVTGWGADLIVVDDPFGSFDDAMSPLVRKRVTDWFTGTLMSRLNGGKGAVVVICARWHEDDLSGFLLREAADEWTEIRLPAIADDDDDPLGRELGEALWPDLYSLADLERMRTAMSLSLGESVWMAQAQQTPQTPTGGMFPADRWVQVATSAEVPACPRLVRAWDLAATDSDGDYTVGALMGLTADNRIVIRDLVRGQWSADEVRHRMLSCAETDPAGTHIELPQDPGQAGKDQAQQLTRMLTGFSVRSQPVSGNKEIRATGFAAQQQAGNVILAPDDGAQEPWHGKLIAECAAFPKGRHDDIVDACASGFNWLVRGRGSKRPPVGPAGPKGPSKWR